MIDRLVVVTNAWIANVALLAVEVLVVVLIGWFFAYGIQAVRELGQAWHPMTPEDREDLRQRQARFRKRVGRRLQRQRNRPARGGRGRHTAH